MNAGCRIRGAAGPEIHGDGNADLGDPDVGRVNQVVLVWQYRESALAPVVAPGVLNDESFGGVADERDRVSGIGLATPLDDRQPPFVADAPHLCSGIGPSGMNHEGDVDNADIGERRMHVADVPVHHAVIRAAWHPAAFQGAVLGEVLRPVQRIGPGASRADAVRHPALHRTARRRSFVGLTRPLVEAPCHLIEHPRADLEAFQSARRAVVLDDCGQRETGARSFLSLIENRRYPVAVDDRVGQRIERRPVEPVADVDAVGHGVQPLLDLLLDRSWHGRRSSRRPRWTRGLRLRVRAYHSQGPRSTSSCNRHRFSCSAVC